MLIVKIRADESNDTARHHDKKVTTTIRTYSERILGHLQFIADSTDSSDQEIFGMTETFTKPFNMDINRPVIPFKIHSPYMLNDLFP